MCPVPCGWTIRCDGPEMWSEASHATELHLGSIDSVKDCPICAKFPEEVAWMRKQKLGQHIDADRIIGKTAWDEECQESGRLNRR